MWPLLVVKANTVPERLPSLGTGFEFAQVDTFPFHQSPQSFNENIIHPSAFAVHGNSDSGHLENADKLLAGKL